MLRQYIGVTHDLGQIEEAPSDTVPLDPKTFTALVREHQAGLRAFVRSLGVEADWVDDIAQETFLVAYRKQAQFETGREFGRWVRGIARHLVANERRKHARHARLLSGALTALLDEASESTEPFEEMDSAKLIKAMNECVARLPERGRSLLTQRYEKGDTAPVLALAFNLSPDAVRQMLVRLRAAVKRCVEDKLSEGTQ